MQLSLFSASATVGIEVPCSRTVSSQSSCTQEVTARRKKLNYSKEIFGKEVLIMGLFLLGCLVVSEPLRLCGAMPAATPWGSLAPEGLFTQQHVCRNRQCLLGVKR